MSGDTADGPFRESGISAEEFPQNSAGCVEMLEKLLCSIMLALLKVSTVRDLGLKGGERTRDSLDGDLYLWCRPQNCYPNWSSTATLAHLKNSE